ncbi:MAG: DUF1801 domain-containing protein, partial [Acidobacteriota bacterium]|nr:DUF1801 domain-containing protein [Acidobacteriota bacterium]
MPPRNPKVDALLSQHSKWFDEFDALRTIALSFPLTEERKWYQPCYTLNGKNVILIHGFKDYCALLFFKGALLKDTQKILATPGSLQSGRQLRFTCVKDIVRLKLTIKAYIAEAIEIEKSGKKVKLKSTSDYEIPAEFK